VRDAGDGHPVAIGAQHGRNDRDALPGFGEREQSVRRTALDQNIGLDIGHTAGCIEQPHTVPRWVTVTKVRRRFRSILLISKLHK
jgi:hypothetical protein